MQKNPSLNHGVAISGVQNCGAGSSSIWFDWERKEGTILDNSLSKDGPDFINHYKEDIEIASKLGLKFFRLSLDWARLEPQQGSWDHYYIQWFTDVLKEIARQKMEPVVTLLHFDYPFWFEKMGGFQKVENILHVDSYVHKAIVHFGSKVKFWITVNEPNTWAFQSFVLGMFPPGFKSNLRRALNVYRNLARVHTRAYTIIKTQFPNSFVAPSINFCLFQPFNQHSILEKLTIRFLDNLWNYRYLDWCVKTYDFIGLQYYNTATIQFKLGGELGGICNEYGLRKPSGRYPTSDIFWDINSQGLEHFLSSVWKKHKKPIFITELGHADKGEPNDNTIVDSKRISYMKSCRSIIYKAIHSGVPLIGVLWWTLVDNWEWALGFTPSFGFYRVLPSGKRIARESTKVFKTKQ